jgi:NAD(P)-dependent dehydrogenase (short-subunit alcohol dehydrogenase family)
MSMEDTDDRTVIVTGASSGIGRAIAIEFANQGATVVCASRSNEPRQGEVHHSNVTRPTESYISEETPGNGRFISTDVSDINAVRALMDATVERYGGIDVLVNNAGIYIPGDSQSTSIRDWEQLLSVDLNGTFYCAKYAIPHLKSSSGTLLNISSVNAHEGGAGPAYAAAKAAVVNLTRDLAVELGEYSVNVNCISPGYIKTPMQDYQDEDSIETSRDQTLLPDLGEPKDVATVARFLASDGASFIHGEEILVDGGWSAHRV